jgi:organic hydroperoxide reductase OsmC/OhrA
MPARARTFTFDVSLDREWAAHSARGGSAIPNEEEEWTPEHLVLAALSRCSLTSFRHHARRAGHEPELHATAHGVVTRREEDGRFAFVEIRVEVEAGFTSPASHEEIRELIVKGERDCFVGASLTAAPDYHWTVNGEDFS